MKKIESIGTPLKNWDVQINYGVKTGFNEAFIIDRKIKEELLREDPKSGEIIRPILRGRDIKRYAYNFADCWLINVHNGIKERDIKPININDYPAVKKHLDNYVVELETRADKGVSPYNLRNCAYMEDFSKQKIVWGNLNLKATYAFAEEGIYINAPCSMIVPANKYILAVLNSKLADYYIRNLGVTRNGGYFEYKPMFIEQLPIPMIDQSEQEKFASIVSEIIVHEKNLLNTKKYQEELDEMIFDLYQLSKEEKKILL